MIFDFFKKKSREEIVDYEIDEGATFRKTSYSQCGEDLIIKHIFDTLQVYSFQYLDIGAHHPYYLSNTALFYSLGCRGANIEPDTVLFDNFKKSRAEDVNLNVGVGEVEGELDFYVISVPTLNTFSKEEAEGYKKEGVYNITRVDKVKVLTVERIVTQFFNNIFPEFLTIDAEGVDELVLKSINYDENSPIIICVETISFSDSGRGIKNEALISFLTNKGYLLYADTNINSIFVKKDKWER